MLGTAPFTDAACDASVAPCRVARGRSPVPWAVSRCRGSCRSRSGSRHGQGARHGTFLFPRSPLLGYPPHESGWETAGWETAGWESHREASAEQEGGSGEGSGQRPAAHQPN